MAIALMLGGGAPTLTLETGALAALDEKGVEFDAVSTAGAGMVVGLLYAAPKGKTRQQALADSKHMGVHDSIYSQFPINFKVFHKPGPMAEFYRNFLGAMPRIALGNSSSERFFNDWMALMFSSFCPSDLGLSSKGLCEHAPWIDDIVDFDKLKAFRGEFYMNAYNVTDQKMDIFDKDEITPAHFRSSLAFPMIYAPYKLNGKTYIEGSAIDTLCFRGLLEYRDDRIEKRKDLDPLEHIVIFDVLSSKKIIREPQNLYDAWIQSIMIPLVEIAKDDIKMYEHIHSRNWKNPPKIKKIEFDIPADHWPHVLDWSYSNLEILYDVGYKAGLKFFEDNKDIWQKKEDQEQGRAWQVIYSGSKGVKDDERREALNDLHRRDVDLPNAPLEKAKLAGITLPGAGLAGAKLAGATLTKADLPGSLLTGAQLSSADLSGADLSGADLRMADLSSADLSDAHLSQANLSECKLIKTTLSGASLFKANLAAADLSRAKLSKACLAKATLPQANLSNADLSKANLSGADLSGADLFEAILTKADLSGADLSGVRFLKPEQLNSACADPARPIRGLSDGLNQPPPCFKEK